MNGKKLPLPNSILVSVVNGSGISNQASNVANSLKNLGFRIQGIGNATPVSSQAQETIVYYSSGYEAQAEAVSRDLTGYVVMSLNTRKVTNGTNVTVLTGTGVSVINTTSNTKSNNNTTTQPKSTNNSSITSSNPADGFSAPSKASEGLTPWDPKACTN
jgi:hypothetical protein